MKKEVKLIDEILDFSKMKRVSSKGHKRNPLSDEPGGTEILVCYDNNEYQIQPNIKSIRRYVNTCVMNNPKSSRKIRYIVNNETREIIKELNT